MRGDRLDVELVRRGLARSRARATELVSGGFVRVGGVPALKPSTPVVADDDLTVEGAAAEYVSRGGRKLAGALDLVSQLTDEGPVVEGAWCLDVGASTGGFTQVLLDRGAGHVLAVDVGHGQLAPEIADDARVSVREGLNARDLTIDDVPVRPSLVVGDLSFISLTLVLPALFDVIEEGGDLVLLVKPQFEVGRTRLGNDGVVTSARARADAVLAVARAAAERVVVVAVVPSPLPGPAGNREYFLWLRDTAGGRRPVDLTGMLETAVRGAVEQNTARLVRPPYRGDPRRPS